ncbi:MAG TPA: GGDEF domain-containing protein [Candidatus Hydrogenedentes bacterium]|nr:GGDEF domain-containing protein [Candidatus Hydrogenedentota bacterium]
MSDDTTNHGPIENPSDMTRLISEISGNDPISSSGLRASLIVLSGWEIGKEIDVTQSPVVLGRSTSADAFINSPSVSRRHAKIELVQDNQTEYFIITDLKSSNGTLVNNAPAISTRLQDGDKIRMGDVVFKFVLQDSIDVQFHQEVHRRIHFDQLTGLLKMDAFRQRMDEIIRQGRRHHIFTLAMTDLDGLKRVNDTHGHLAGRMIIREMGAMMRATLRPSDLAGLYGGDEAIILFPETPLIQAKETAEALRRVIQDRVFTFQENTFGVTISQGLAEWPRHGDTVEKIIAAADKALYTAKHAGRNCVCTADDA